MGRVKLEICFILLLMAASAATLLIDGPLECGQWDALCHLSPDGHIYKGFAATILIFSGLSLFFRFLAFILRRLEHKLEQS